MCIVSLVVIPASALAVPPPGSFALDTFGSSTSQAHDVEFDASGNLFASGHQFNGGRVYRIAPDGTTQLYLGAWIGDVWGLALDSDGSLLAVDADSDSPSPAAGRIVRITSAGTTPAGPGCSTGRCWRRP